MSHDVILVESPNKTASAERALRACRRRSSGVASCGHLMGWPSSLVPLGFSLNGDVLEETLRAPVPRAPRFMDGLRHVLPGAETVWIASDGDSEGHVIALDMLEAVTGFGGRAKARRITPRSFSPAAMQEAVEAASPVCPEDMALDMALAAVPGRARAVLDRWMGLVLSRVCGFPCGRVRLSLLALSLLRERGGIAPLTGHAVLRCPVAMVPGAPPGASFAYALAEAGSAGFAGALALAHAYAGGAVPGSVRMARACGAQLAPGLAHGAPAAPGSTVDLVCHLSRMPGWSPNRAMQAMQSAWEEGRITYPRGTSRHVDHDLRAGLARMAQLAGIQNIDTGRLDAVPPPAAGDAPHGAVLPVAHGRRGMEELRGVFYGTGGSDSDEAVRAAARFAFGALSDRSSLPGIWHGAERDGDGSPDVCGDLDWRVEMSPPPPWGRDMETGPRPIGAAAGLVACMEREGLGRPSTWTVHAESALREGLLIPQPDPFAPPRLSDRARKALASLPKALLSLRLHRRLQSALDRRSSRGEARGGPLAGAGRRIRHALSLLPQSAHEFFGPFPGTETVAPPPRPVPRHPVPQRFPQRTQRGESPAAGAAGQSRTPGPVQAETDRGSGKDRAPVHAGRQRPAVQRTDPVPAADASRPKAVPAADSAAPVRPPAPEKPQRSASPASAPEAGNSRQKNGPGNGSDSGSGDGTLSVSGDGDGHECDDMDMDAF